MKPDERIYAESIRHLGREPDEVVFIDDREENVAAAREFGIDAIQYTSQRDLLQELGQRSLLS